MQPDDREDVNAAWNAALRGMPYDIVHRIVVAGAVRWVHERADVEFGPDGEALDRPVEVGAPRAHAKGLSFDFDEADDLPAKVLGDPTRVVQVLLNLLGNAVKFTSRGRVLLSVRRGERDIIVFRVEDTGIGISETEMARLFHPFEQADNSTRRHDGGTGLGLAISWWT